MTRTSKPDFEENTLNAGAIQGDEIQEGDRYGYKVVATILQGWNAWVAYRGPTTWDDIRVAESGDPVSEDAANALFPTLAAIGRVYSA